MTVRRAATIVLLAASVLLASGCGIEQESTASRTDPDAVPFGLLEEPEAAPAAQPSGMTVTVYLLADGILVPVDRSASDDADLDEIAELLASGPTEAERDLGLSSSLPEGQVIGVESSRGVAEVDLADAFADLNARDQAQAIAQLTYSLTGRPGIGGVTFTLDGTPTEVPRGDGTLTADPLTREDLTAIAPRP